jgi:hypothetical protein
MEESASGLREGAYCSSDVTRSSDCMDHCGAEPRQASTACSLDDRGIPGKADVQASCAVEMDFDNKDPFGLDKFFESLRSVHLVRFNAS